MSPGGTGRRGTAPPLRGPSRYWQNPIVQRRPFVQFVSVRHPTHMPFASQ